MKQYQVVAAVVCKDGRYLCMQKGRTKYDYTSYKWEFPGGKIEAHETPQEALAREMMEELDFPVEVGRNLVTVSHDYPDFRITMTAYMCSPHAEHFTMKEHIAYRWCSKEEISLLDWAAADVDIVKAIVSSADHTKP